MKKARTQKWLLGAFAWLFESVYTQNISGKKQETTAQVPVEEWNWVPSEFGPGRNPASGTTESVVGKAPGGTSRVEPGGWGVPPPANSNCLPTSFV